MQIDELREFIANLGLNVDGINKTTVAGKIFLKKELKCQEN